MSKGFSVLEIFLEKGLKSGFRRSPKKRCLNFFENGSLDFRDFQYSMQLEIHRDHVLAKTACQKDFPFLRFLGKGTEIWVLQVTENALLKLSPERRIGFS